MNVFNSMTRFLRCWKKNSRPNYREKLNLLNWSKSMNSELPKPDTTDNGLRGSTLKRPMDRAQMGQDTAALNALCGFLNVTTERSEKDVDPRSVRSAPLPPASTPADSTGATMLASDPIMTSVVMPEQQLAPAATTAAPEVPVAGLTRFFTTGRMCVGKDYIATKIGAEVHGFSEPLYALASYFFGFPVDANTNKDLPGMREFLQRAGMWGRQHISNDYPLTTERAAFIAMIRGLPENTFPSTLGVSWHNYGTDENLWLNAALVRIALSNSERVAITNTRFENEFKKLSENGFVNWHVMTSPGELQARQAKRGVKPGAASLRDVSESLADKLDRQVIKTVSAQRNGPKLRVVWNSDTPPPSPRLWTVAEFVRAFNK
jgi:hypothetical protein